MLKVTFWKPLIKYRLCSLLNRKEKLEKKLCILQGLLIRKANIALPNLPSGAERGARGKKNPILIISRSGVLGNGSIG